VRRLIRILGRIGVGVSLLLCLVTMSLWVRSYWKTEWWSRFPYDVRTHEYGQGWVHSGRGRTALILWSFKIDDGLVRQMEARAAKGDFSGRWLRSNLLLTWPERQHWWERIVFVQVKKNVRSGWGVGSGVMVIVPYWVLVLVSAIGPGVWGIKWWERRRRFGEGRCQKCGYDVRASPERCPECGTEIGTRFESSGLEVRN
jgi:hypothetical protein